MNNRVVMALLMAVVLWPSASIATGYGFLNFQGLITDAGDAPLVSQINVNLTFEIYDPTGTCKLYSETQLVNTDSKGMAAASIGTGTAQQLSVSATVFPDIFKNAGSYTCVGGGGPYNPSSGDTRKIRIYVGGSALTPDVALAAVPFAFIADNASNADKLQGLAANQFVQASGNVTQANLGTVVNGGDASTVHHHDGRYVRINSANTGTFSIGSIGTNQLSLAGLNNAAETTLIAGPPTAGTVWLSGTTSKLRYYDGVNPQNIASQSYVDANLGSRALANTTPAAGQYLGWNNAMTRWEPSNLPSMVSSFNGRSGTVTPAANDYNWTQIDKTSSSLADLATRSATDLNGGTLADVRLSGNVALKTYVDSKLATRAISSALPANGQIIAWNNSLTQWEPTTVAGGVTGFNGRTGAVSPAANDYGFSMLSGSVADSQLSSNIATKNYSDTNLGTRSLATSTPAAGQVIAWNNTTSKWEPTTLAATGVTTFNGRSGAVTPAMNDYNWSQIDKGGSSLADLATRSASDLSSGTLGDARLSSNVALKAYVDASLATRPLSSLTPANAQYMGWNNGAGVWEPTTLSATNITAGALPDARLSANVALKSYADGKIASRTASTAAPATGQYIAWNGVTSQWEPTSAPSGVASFNGRNGVVTPAASDYSFPLISGTASDSQLSGNVALLGNINAFSNTQSITVATTAKSGLILKTSDNGTANNIFEVRKSDNTVLYSLYSDGTVTNSTDLATRGYVIAYANGVGGAGLKLNGANAMSSSVNMFASASAPASPAAGSTYFNTTSGIATYDAALPGWVTYLKSSGGALTGNLSIPGTGANSERFGLTANANGNNTFAAGKNASAGGDDGVAIGYGSTITGVASVAIGASSSAAGNKDVIIGKGANSAFDSTVVLGLTATSSASNQFVAGSSAMPIDNIYFGVGTTSAAAHPYTVNGTAGSGSNIVGSDIGIAGGQGTGTGAGGAISFKVATAALSSNTTMNPLAEVMRIVPDAAGTGLGRVGIGTSSPASNLDIVSNMAGNATAVRVYNSDVTGAARYIVGANGAGNGALTIEAYGTSSTYGSPAAGDARSPGGSTLYWSGQNGPLNFAATYGTSYLRFFTGGDLASNERMRIDSSGRVGIGTSTPATTLHVSGVIRSDAGFSSGATSVIDSSGNWTGNALGGSKIAAASITDSNLVAGTITGASIANGTIVNANISSSAAIADTKLATISTSGKVSNSATTAVNTNAANAIVARDGSGNFSAGTITANGFTANPVVATDTSNTAAVYLTPSFTMAGGSNVTNVGALFYPWMTIGGTNATSTIIAQKTYIVRSSDAGTLNEMSGAEVYYGHGVAVTGTTTNAYGLRIHPSYQSGALTNSYALYIDNPTVTGAAVTNDVALYQASPSAMNVFKGVVGIGTANPDALLRLTANTATANASSFLKIVNTSGAGQSAEAISFSSAMAGNKNWAIAANLEQQGAFSIRSAAPGTDPISSGTTVIYASPTGQVALGGNTLPTAGLQLAATLSANSPGTAPLKFVTGPLLTTPEQGAMEYDGVKAYVTYGDGKRRPAGASMFVGLSGNTVGAPAVSNAINGATIGGYGGAGTKCDSRFPGSHMCTGDEMVRYLQAGNPWPLAPSGVNPTSSFLVYYSTGIDTYSCGNWSTTAGSATALSCTISTSITQSCSLTSTATCSPTNTAGGPLGYIACCE